MNLLTKTGIAAALLSTALFANAAEAQQKVGFVSIQQVFGNLPEARNLEQKVEDEFKSRIEEINALQTKMGELSEKAQRDRAILSQADLLNMEREMEMLETQRQLKTKAVREDMNRRGGELRDQLMAEVMRNAQAVAQEQNYDVVVRATALVYAKDSSDLTDDVIKKMTGGK